MGKLQFWFEFGSTYSYPAAMRIEGLADTSTVQVEYMPFLLGPIFADQGWNDSPFNLHEAKGRYMWRDLERVCEGLGLPWNKPSVFPRNSLLPARLATAAIEEPWLPEFVRRIYTANFVNDQDISDPDVVSAALKNLVEDAPGWVERAGAPEVKQQLRANTDLAVARGIFGAPSIWVDGELYWGHDRMEVALAHAASTPHRH